MAAIDSAVGDVPPPLPIEPPALPKPIWLGYQRRARRMAAEYQNGYLYPVDLGPIVEVCTFGHATGLGGSNAMACFPSVRAMAEWHGARERRSTDLYAYRAVPLLFDTSGTPRPLKPPEILGEGARTPRSPNRARYTRLGYDITECRIGDQWADGCSPLSLGCNSMALGMGSLVNQYCLVDDVGAAYDMAILFGVQRPEPGPYLIVEVWRQTTEE